jgi:glycosyltransferase involved in cell wall biosynthesis
MLEIIEVCQQQDYDNFEVVVIEQSDDTHWQAHQKAFDGSDSRIRIIRSRPLGSAAAKNLGVHHSKGDVVLFIDDDDVPIGKNWISSHASHYADPLCIGISGRCIKRPNEKVPYKNKDMAYQRCLTYSFFLRGRDLTGIDKPKKPVEWLHGLNASIRRSYVVDLGGWYPYVDNIDEHSFCFKLRRILQPGEYLIFDPQPVVLRRFDLPGGLGKRYLSLHQVLVNHLLYYHRVVGKHFPLRYYSLYPFFMLYVFRFATRWFRTYSYFADSHWIRWFGAESGRRLYILQEFLKFPFTAFHVLISRKPKWSGQLDDVKPRTD